MSGKQGEALATIGEIVQQHGGIQRTIPVAQPSLFEDIADLVSDRPYAATVIALAVGFLGGRVDRVEPAWNAILFAGLVKLAIPVEHHRRGTSVD